MEETMVRLIKFVAGALLACNLALGCAPFTSRSTTSDNSTSSAEARQAALAEGQQIIQKLTTEFEAGDYRTRIGLLSVHIKGAAAMEVDVLNRLSAVWRIAIKTGLDPTETISGCLQTSRESGHIELFEMFHATAEDLMRRMIPTPSESAASYQILFQMYSTYSELVSLRQSPRGSLLSFSQTVNSLDLRMDRLASELAVTL
jgi:hypothetical protein